MWNFTYFQDNIWNRKVSIQTVVYDNIDTSVQEGMKDSN